MALATNDYPEEGAVAGNEGRGGRDVHQLTALWGEGRRKWWNRIWLPVQGGTFAPSLLKLRMADTENIYHCNAKEENEGWDRSHLFTCPFPKQKTPLMKEPGVESIKKPDHSLGSSCSTLTQHWISWCLAGALPAQGWWLLFHSDTGMGTSALCCLQVSELQAHHTCSRCCNSLIAQTPAEQLTLWTILQLPAQPGNTGSLKNWTKQGTSQGEQAWLSLVSNSFPGQGQREECFVQQLLPPV